MDKQLFIETMNQIKELTQEQEKFNTMLQSIDSEFGGGFIHHKSISILVNLLKILMEDNYENIEYYIWELDFGNKYYDGCITTEDGQIIRMSTPEELYDMIMADKN